MAHSDALIFLTNITWVFFLFLFTYFFFVLFVLPTFYKKFRVRVLLKNINFLGGILAVRSVLVALVFCVDTFKALSLLVVNTLKSVFSFLRTPNFDRSLNVLGASASELPAAEVVRKYNLNLLFVEVSTSGNIVFTRFLKI